MTGRRPTVVHVTTTDISLELLLGPQLQAFAVAGFEVVGASAPGSIRRCTEAAGCSPRRAETCDAFVCPVRGRPEPSSSSPALSPPPPGHRSHTQPEAGRLRPGGRPARGVPGVVNTVHGLYALPDDPAPKRALVYGLERLAAACSNAELVQKSRGRRRLATHRRAAQKVMLLGNGIDLRRFDPETISTNDAAAARVELGAIAPTDVVVGVVGRLVHDKGYREVFDAAARLRHRNPALRFAVIGPEEPGKTRSLSRAEKSAAADAGVCFLGRREDVERLYRGMDIYVLASYREGFPRSAMEAAAMRLPIVATDIRGCRQVVDPGVTGLLVPAHDSRALADAIGALAIDPERRLRMGAAGREKALREFDQQRCIDLTLSVYRRLIARSGIELAEARPS